MTIDRRSLLTAALASALFPAHASSASAAGPVLHRRLRAGDTVGIVAPAKYVSDLTSVERAEQLVRDLGLVPKRAANLFRRNGYFAGDDRERAASINAMYADRAVQALVAVEGGWGCQRILPYLDYRLIAANPKLLIGSSDITALHLALAAYTQQPSLHGPNAGYTWSPAQREAFRALASQGATPTFTNPKGEGLVPLPPRWQVRTYRAGKARGRLLGGNLSVLSSLVGTRYLPSFKGAILFLEDTNEAEYRIDRMLTQLAQGGILGQVAGVAFGQCTNCRNPVPTYNGFTLDEVLHDHLAPLGVPAFQGAQIGHISDQLIVPVGAMAEIDATAGSIRVLTPVVG